MKIYTKRTTRNTIEARKYSINDRWNADEFGLFYSMAPNTTLGPARLAGRKKQKDRMTFLACVNADGMEKFPLMTIGKSARPRCFQGREPNELLIDYHYSPKAWIILCSTPG